MTNGYKRETRNKPLHMESNNFSTRVSSQFKREREVFSTNGVGKTSIRMTKNEGPRLITYIKINTKWNKDLNVKR